MKKDVVAATLVTIYLIVYTVLFHANAPLPLLGSMFLFSPFLVIWMAYTIIKHGTFTGKDLDKDEEWGYNDKARSEFEGSAF